MHSLTLITCHECKANVIAVVLPLVQVDVLCRRDRVHEIEKDVIFSLFDFEVRQNYSD